MSGILSIIRRFTRTVPLRTCLATLCLSSTPVLFAADYSEAVIATTISVPSVGTATPCSYALDFDQFEKVMASVGWPVRTRGYPQINWPNNLAVVIAPAGLKSNEKLVFEELRSDQDNLVLSWRVVKGEMQARNRVRSTTRGLRPMQDVLVVEFPRSIFDTHPLICRELQ